jgi:uncharacterized protein (DUF433 family)
MSARAPLNYGDGFTPSGYHALGGVQDETKAQILTSEILPALGFLFAPLADFEYPNSMTQKQKAQLDEVVWVDPDRMSGQPCFKGTRVPVQALVDRIEGNSTLDDFLKGFPSVSREQAIRFIELAKENLLACVSS